MARNPKPLNILVSKSLAHLKEIQLYAEKGHNLVIMSENSGNPDDYDMIWSPNAWRMTDELADTSGLLDISVTACRAIKYKRTKKDKDEND